VTRFVLVMREDERPTGRDRTSIAFTLDRDRPGGLHEVLGEFARRGINLSKIESRPNKRAMGHYIFFLDFEGHRQDAPGAQALAGVLERVHGLHLLGSYPRGEPP
jgi:prephenate dehydratase